MKAVFLVLVFAHFARGWVAWLAVCVVFSTVNGLHGYRRYNCKTCQANTHIFSGLQGWHDSLNNATVQVWASKRPHCMSASLSYKLPASNWSWNILRFVNSLPKFCSTSTQSFFADLPPLPLGGNIFDLGTQVASPIRRSDPWRIRLTSGVGVTVDMTPVNPGFSGLPAGSTVLPPRNPHIEVTNFTADFQEIDVFGRILKAFKWWSGSLPKFLNSNCCFFKVQRSLLPSFTPLFGFLSWRHFLTWELFTSSYCSRSVRQGFN